MTTIQWINKLINFILKETRIWRDMPTGTSKYLASALYLSLTGTDFAGFLGQDPLYTTINHWPRMYTRLHFTYKEEGPQINRASISFIVYPVSKTYKMTLFDNNKQTTFCVQAGDDPILKQLFMRYYSAQQSRELC